MKSSDILYENGKYWVCKSDKKGYEVYEIGVTHSVRRAIIGFEGAEGLERAKMYCDRYALVDVPQATEAAKDLEVQETVQQAKELDVTPLGDLCPKCEWPTGICICTKQVHNAAKELGEYVQKWSQDHDLHTHILNHK